VGYRLIMPFDKKYITPALAIPALCGALLALCFPTPGFSVLAWVALVPFFLTLPRCQNNLQSFKSGFILGLVFFFGTQYWIYHSINHFGHVPLPLSFLLVLLLCLYQSLYTGVFGLLLYLSAKKTKIPTALSAAALWTFIEYLRGVIFTGFPWSFLGYSQWEHPTVIQIADVTGVYGVSFLIVFCNAAAAQTLIGLRERNPRSIISRKPFGLRAGFSALAPAAASVILISLTLFYGRMRIAQIDAGEFFDAASPVSISVVQGNISQDKKWDGRFQGEVMDTYEGLTLEAQKNVLKNAPKDAPKNTDTQPPVRVPAHLPPRLIIWPETAVPFAYLSDKELTGRLNVFQKSLGANLLFGSVMIRGEEGGRYLLTNSAVLLTPDGKIGYVYNKIHLVPFGEYVPLSKLLFFVDKLVAGIGDFQEGENFRPARTPDFTFGVHICYEIVFPALVGRFYKDGGDFIVTITNDAWFGATTGPYQHFSMAALRAVENRKFLVRAANTGISGFIDPAGRVTTKSALMERTVITKNIFRGKVTSFYTAYGNIFVYLCGLFCALILIRTRGR